MIDDHVDFSFVREQVKDFYSPTGRPSIDPEVLLRLLLVGYLYGITSERRLMDEVSLLKNRAEKHVRSFPRALWCSFKTLYLRRSTPFLPLSGIIRCWQRFLNKVTY
jgi:hypothetical protein